jgi:hypothetical protein
MKPVKIGYIQLGPIHFLFIFMLLFLFLLAVDTLVLK